MKKSMSLVLIILICSSFVSGCTSVPDAFTSEEVYKGMKSFVYLVERSMSEEKDYHKERLNSIKPFYEESNDYIYDEYLSEEIEDTDIILSEREREIVGKAYDIDLFVSGYLQMMSGEVNKDDEMGVLLIESTREMFKDDLRSFSELTGIPIKVRLK